MQSPKVGKHHLRTFCTLILSYFSGPIPGNLLQIRGSRKSDLTELWTSQTSHVAVGK